MYPVSPETDPNRVIIFDTSLRDGEQAPGFSMGLGEKLRVASVLEALRVDVIEAGFAAASPGDAAAITAVAEQVQQATVCSLARAKDSDIEAAARALETAQRSRVHIFLATSPIHREAKLKMSRAEVLRCAVDTVSLALPLFDEVEFSAEDAIRTEPAFLAEVMRAVAEAGATTLNVPDTVGYSTPPEMTRLFTFLRTALADFKGIRLSAHCHNDLGLAVANSLAAVEAGARQVECTINGIGERAGNCALEELIMALRTRADLYGLETGIDTTRIAGASRTLSRATHSVVVRNKAVVGRNAFAHESGIHQHGMLNDARTYEIMRPQDVGLDQSQLVLGKHSGRHALIKQAAALGYPLEEPGLTHVFAAFKARADQVGEIDTHELRKLLQAATSQNDAPSTGWTLRAVSSQTSASQEARVALELSRDDREAPMLLTGAGPDVLAACLSALNTGFGRTATIRDSEIVQAGFTFETGAFAELTLLFDHEEIRGRGRGPDPVWAAARALIDAFEKAPDGPGRAAVLPTFSKDTHYETAC